MIIDYTVKNYCSVRGELKLSFLPQKGVDKKMLDDIYIVEPIKGLKLLKLGIVMGANASGKTTLLRALNDLRTLVINPLQTKTQKITSYRPWGVGNNKNLPTFFQINFIVYETRYRYEVSFNNNCIVSEHLFLIDKSKSSTVFSRNTNMDSQTIKIRLGINYKKYYEEFRVLEKATLWNNTVFGGFLKTSVDVPFMKSIAEWFSGYLYPIIEPGTNLYVFVSEQIKQGNINKDNLKEFIKRADLMIDNFELKSETWDSLDERTKIQLVEANPDKNFEEIKGKITIMHIEFQHKSGKDTFSVQYNDESLGTQRYYQLCGIFDMLLSQKCFFCIDEIDSSLHPDLLDYLLLVFLFNSKNSQLLISTHHREWLQRDDIVRPDTIWFTQKIKDGSSTLYSLADFLYINDFNKSFDYYTAYKKGLLGAKPSLGDYMFDVDSLSVRR